jgi:DNA adenine methylase
MSFLRWAGSKRKLLPRLRAYWKPSFKRYVEPFMGSACLFFNLRPKTAILGDVNAELVTTFLAVRDRPRAVYHALQRIPRGRRSYDRLRRNLTQLEDVDRAARFIFLNRFCFNGLYRTNRAGQFNVPFTSSRNGHLPTLKELLRTSRSLSTVEVFDDDFETTLSRAEEGDFAYIDPPFAVSNRRIFRQYGPDSFGLEDLKRLQKQLILLDARGVTFVVSYALCAEALNTFRGWQIEKTFTQRNISGFAKHRRKAAELLISNCGNRH